MLTKLLPPRENTSKLEKLVCVIETEKTIAELVLLPNEKEQRLDTEFFNPNVLKFSSLVMSNEEVSVLQMPYPSRTWHVRFPASGMVQVNVEADIVLPVPSGHDGKAELIAVQLPSDNTLTLQRLALNEERKFVVQKQKTFLKCFQAKSCLADELSIVEYRKHVFVFHHARNRLAIIETATFNFVAPLTFYCEIQRVYTVAQLCNICVLVGARKCTLVLLDRLFPEAGQSESKEKGADGEPKPPPRYPPCSKVFNIPQGLVFPLENISAQILGNRLYVATVNSGCARTVHMHSCDLDMVLQEDLASSRSVVWRSEVIEVGWSGQKSKRVISVALKREISVARNSNKMKGTQVCFGNF